MAAQISLVKFLQTVYALLKGAVRESDKALQSAQDSLSETERERRTGLKQKRKVKLKAGSSSSSSETSDAEEGYKWDRCLERKQPAGNRRGSEKEKKDNGGTTAPATLDPWPQGSGAISLMAPPPVTPSAPPMSYGAGSSFIDPVTRRELQNMFPVLEEERERVYRQVDALLVRELAMSVKQYGLHANYTLSLLERMGGMNMTPSDWQFVVKAVLPNMGSYLNWKGLWQELLAETARANQQRSGEALTWTYNMLSGQGQYSDDQNRYPWPVYTQISTAAIKAWKALSLKGQEKLGITQVKQEPDEPFADFVARVMQAVERTFGEGDQNTRMVEQIIWEQCNAECRALLKDRKSKGISDWLKVCRDTGGPLTAHGLAAAILRSNHRERTSPVCFHCGKPGHMKRKCRAGPSNKPPGICPRCRKGRHWANECKSVKDIKGRPLSSQEPKHPLSQESKNGRWGSKAQVPSTDWALFRHA